MFKARSWRIQAQVRGRPVDLKEDDKDGYCDEGTSEGGWGSVDRHSVADHHELSPGHAAHTRVLSSGVEIKGSSADQETKVDAVGSHLASGTKREVTAQPRTGQGPKGMVACREKQGRQRVEDDTVMGWSGRKSEKEMGREKKKRTRKEAEDHGGEEMEGEGNTKESPPKGSKAQRQSPKVIKTPRDAPCEEKESPNRTSEQREVSHQEAQNLASRLASEPEGTAEMLQRLLTRHISVRVMLQSGLGMAVKALRRSTSADVASLASNLTSKWKDLVHASEKAKAPATSATQCGQQEPCSTSRGSKPSRCSSRGGPNASKVTNPPREFSRTTKLDAARDGDNDTRKKAVAVLSKALGSPWSGGKNLARDLERSVFERWDGTTAPEYLQMVKSLAFNLDKNADLRARVNSGAVSCTQVVRLTPEEMANSHRAQGRAQNFAEAAFQDSMFLTAKEQGAQTDKFLCPRCNKKDAKFFHEHLLPDNFWAYTNEAMQINLECRVCGHSWRE